MSRTPVCVPSGFTVDTFIAEGASGEVYRARQLSLDRDVALKIYRRDLHSSSTDVARFLREAKVAGRLDHPHIVQTFDAGIVAGHPYLSMELCDGGTLKDRIASTNGVGARNAKVIASFVDILIDVARAMATLHGVGVIHRDLKPSNILFDGDGRPKIADFGIAWLEGDDTITSRGEILGTIPYMAPELLDHRRKCPASARTDVYSLGVVLYEILTGARPCSETGVGLIQAILASSPRSPRQLNEQIPTELNQICLKAIHRDPAERYETAVDFARDLESFRNNRPIMAMPPTWRYQVRKWCARNPRKVVTVAVSLALITLAVVTTWNQNRKYHSESTRLHGLARQCFADHRYAEAVASLHDARRLARQARWSASANVESIDADLRVYSAAAASEAKWSRFSDARQAAIAMSPPASEDDVVRRLRACDEALTLYDAFSPTWKDGAALRELSPDRRKQVTDQLEELLGEYVDLGKAHSMRIIMLNGRRCFLVNQRRKIPIVAQLSADSELAKQGVRINDRLLRVDGRPTFSLTSDQLSALESDYRHVGKELEFASHERSLRISAPENSSSNAAEVTWKFISHIHVAEVDSPDAADLKKGDVILAIGDGLSQYFDPTVDRDRHELRAMQVRLSLHPASPIKTWVQHDDGTDEERTLSWVENDRKFVHDRAIVDVAKNIRMEFGGVLFAARRGTKESRANYGITDPDASMADLARQSFCGSYGWPAEVVDEALIRTGLLDTPRLLTAMDKAAKKQSPEALELLRAHIRENPADADAFLVQVSICLELKRLGEIIQASTDYLNLRPREVTPRFFRAMTLAELGEVDGAIRDLEFILTIRPDDERSLQLLRQLKDSNGRPPGESPAKKAGKVATPAQ